MITQRGSSSRGSDKPDSSLRFDKTNPDAWFEHEFGPYSRVADYANAPPRGMTNAPMNRELRKTLCQDLVEYGLASQVEDWEPGFIAKSASAPTTPQQQRQQRLARADRARNRLCHGYMENLRQGRVLKKGSCFGGSAPAIVSGGDGPAPVPPWHQYHPFQQTLRPIDRRGPVATPKTPSMIGFQKEKRSVHFEDNQRTLEEHLAYGGSPQNTNFIKTPSHEKALTVGRSLTFGDTRRPSIDGSGGAKKPKDPSMEVPKEEEVKSKQKEARKTVEETELDTGMRTLRGMSQLHKAAVADRFRFGADASAGEPMVLGASSLNKANPGRWSSDAAFLNKFHNSAIRIVHPSGLQMLQEPAEKTKKKKKKDTNNGDEDLKMSDSFAPRYPIDGNLKVLRQIRKKAFPEEEKKEPTPEDKIADAAAKLKMDLGGFGGMLSRVRDPSSEEEKKEVEQALQASGY